MAAHRLEDGTFTTRCEGCNTLAPVSAPNARAAIRASEDHGWHRPRPGVSDYCPKCLNGC
jgi:hypothetical protein